MQEIERLVKMANQIADNFAFHGDAAARIEELRSVARRHDLALIEDAAQAFGGSYRGRWLGSFGHAGAFSFEQSAHDRVIGAAVVGTSLVGDKLGFLRQISDLSRRRKTDR